jgi:hypothetical protein
MLMGYKGVGVWGENVGMRPLMEQNFNYGMYETIEILIITFTLQKEVLFKHRHIDLLKKECQY